MEQISIKLNDKTFFGKIDFDTIAKIQMQIKKDYGIKLKLNEIFEEVDDQNFAVILEVVVQAILRRHGQLEREYVKDQVGLADFESVMNFLVELIEDALPNVKA